MKSYFKIKVEQTSKFVTITKLCTLYVDFVSMLKSALSIPESCKLFWSQNKSVWITVLKVAIFYTSSLLVPVLLSKKVSALSDSIVSYVNFCTLRTELANSVVFLKQEEDLYAEFAKVKSQWEWYVEFYTIRQCMHGVLDGLKEIHWEKYQ